MIVLFWFIVYMMIAAAYFSGFYISMQRIKVRNSHWYDDSDVVFAGVLLSVFWMLTVWFVVPYLYINIAKSKERKP